MSEEQTEEAAIEAINSLIPEDGSFNIGQSEETTEAKPEQAAQPEEETTTETKETEAPVEKPELVPEGDDQEFEIEAKGNKYKVPKAINDMIMMHADYTKKTMALAEKEKALEAQKGQIDPNLAQKLSEYEKLIPQAMNQMQQIDWQQLLRTDPIGYLEQKENFERLKVENEKLDAQQKQQFTADIGQAAEKEWGQLIAKRPDLKEASAFKAHDERVRTFLGQQGYESKDIDKAVFDHRVRLLIEDAIKFRDLQAKNTDTAKRIEKLPPKVERPGVPSGTDSQGAKSAMSRLRSSGKVDDAAAAITALMG